MDFFLLSFFFSSWSSFFGISGSLSLKAWHCVWKAIFPFLELQGGGMEETSLIIIEHWVNTKLVSNFVRISLPLVCLCPWSVKLHWTNTGLNSLLYGFLFFWIFAPQVLAALVGPNSSVCLLIPMTLSKALLASLPLSSLPLPASWASQSLVQLDLSLSTCPQVKAVKRMLCSPQWTSCLSES